MIPNFTVVYDACVLYPNTNLIDLHPVQVIEAIQKCHQRRKNPPCSFEEYLMRLQKQELPNTVSMIKDLM